MDDVIDFPKSRVKPLSEEEALAYLRRKGPIETTVTALAKAWGWERTRTSKVLSRWNADGKITREPGTNNQTVFSAVVAGVQTDVAQAAHPAPHTEAQAAQLTQADVVQPAPPELRADAQSAQPGAQSTPVEFHGVPAWCRWILGGLFILLSLALYGASLFLNATFWPGLAPTVDAKAILAAVGVVIETVNYATPSAISIASMSRTFKRGLWGFWIMTMTTAAVAGASFVRSNLGAAEVQRDATIKERARLEGIIKKPMDPVSDAAVVDARSRVETAKAVAKADCAPVRTKDIDQCNKSKAEVLKAQAALASENTNHTNDVKVTEQRHRDDVEKAKAALEALPVISADRNVILGGITALVPGEVPEAWANRIVAGLWVILFALGPCTLLRSGLELLAPARITRSGVKA